MPRYEFVCNCQNEPKTFVISLSFSDYKAGKFKESAAKSYEVYQIDRKDTLNLFNAAGSSLNGKDYVSAIKYYEELRKMNYSGKGTIFFAINKKTKAEEAFISMSARESNIQAGLYEKPRNYSPPSRKEEILMSPDELKIIWTLRRVLHALDPQQAIELLLNKLRETKTNFEFLLQVQKTTPTTNGDDAE